MASHRRLKICCSITALLFVILSVVVLILYFTILKPKQPEAIAYPVQLTKIELIPFPQLKLNITLLLTVQINNRNYGSFEYKATTAHVNYRGRLLLRLRSQAVRFRSRKHNVSSFVEIMGDKLAFSPQFWMDLGVGSFNFTSLTTLKGRVKVFKILKMSATARSICDVTLSVRSNSVNSTCYSKFKL
ncbi:hypothetical protein Scep_028734 [Stephania cephalantha]|uniref:Late embryogenesis abundant protein LEA-2 subgroup domain-containing protein n=1 Tax=Stephania cephalantha TaxID=152367 RepID=A0AAP0HM30_9MAGN